MNEDKFGLKDEEYWSDPWRTRKAVQRPLMQKNQEGLLLGTPTIVPLNQYQSFPVALREKIERRMPLHVALLLLIIGNGLN